MQFFFQKLQIYSMCNEYNCNSKVSLSDYCELIYFIYLFIYVDSASHNTCDLGYIKNIT